MTAASLLHILRERGAEVWAVDGGNIFVSPRDVLTDELRAEIRAHKPELLRLLTKQRPVGQIYCHDCHQTVDLIPHPDLDGWLLFTCGHRRILRKEFTRWKGETRNVEHGAQNEKSVCSVWRAWKQGDGTRQIPLSTCLDCGYPNMPSEVVDRDGELCRQWSCPRCGKRWSRALEYDAPPPPCPRCGGEFDASPAVRGDGFLRLLCVKCEAFFIASPQGTSDLRCLRCDMPLIRRDVKSGWAQLSCPSCHWTTYEHPSPVPRPPSPTDDVESLKTLWAESWLWCKAALRRGDRQKAGDWFDRWYDADRLLRAALGDGYEDWLKEVSLKNGNWGLNDERKRGDEKRLGN